MQFAIGRLKGLPGAEPFIQPVDERKFPAYREVVAVPMDLTTMEAQLSRGAYTSTAAFVADCKWILHNCILFNGTGNKLTTLAKSLLRMCKWEMEEIETCPDCYGNAYSSDNWFTAACPYPHLLIWARLKGFPFWPAKAMKTRDGNVDCRFFGRHDRAWVPAKECFLFSKDPPAPPKSRSKSLDACVEELRDHVKNLEKRFGKYVYARNKTQYDPNRLPAQLKMTIPGYHEPSPDSGPVTGKRPSGAALERPRDGKRARVSAAAEESEDLGAAAGPAVESAASSSAQTAGSTAATARTCSSGRSGRTSAASAEKPDTRAEPDVGAEPDAGGKPDTGEKVESVEKAALSGKPDLNGAPDVSEEVASSVKPDTCVKAAPKAKPDTSVKTTPNAKPDTSVKTALRGKPDTSEKTALRAKPDETQESQKSNANNERAAETERRESTEQSVSGQKLAAAVGSAKNKATASADKSAKTVKSPSVEKSVTGSKPASVVKSSSGTEASKRLPVVVKKLGTLDAAVSVENCSDGEKTSLSPSVETPDGTERVVRVEKTGRGGKLGSGRKETVSDKKTGKKADTINTDKACKVQKKEEPKTITLSAKTIKKEPFDADSSNSEAAGATPVSSSSTVAVQAAEAAQSRTSRGPSWSSRRKTARKSLAGAAISSVAARLSGNRAAAAEPPSKPSPSGPPEKPSTAAAKPAAAARRSSGSHTVVIPVSAAVSTASTTIVVGPQARSAASRPPQPSTSVVVVSRDPAASSPTTVRLSAPAQVSAQPLRPKIWTSSAITAVPASSATRAPAPSSATSPPVVVSRRDGARLMIPRSGLYIPAGPQQSAPVMVIPSGVQNGVVTLPSAEVGPVSGEVDRQANSLTELLREGVERYLQDRASAGDWRATNTNLELAMEKREWKHKAEISELNRRHEAQLAEVRSAAELEQKRAVNRLAMAHSAERREWERQTEQKIAETKRKQWCAACGKEAIFYCCWNTSYCDFPCQEAQWPKHMLTCANQQGGHVGDGDGRLG